MACLSPFGGQSVYKTIEFVKGPGKGAAPK
jgi:hypothetical protein